MKYIGNIDVFCFGFYFMSPKWTRTKLVIELQQAYSCLPLEQTEYRFLGIGPERTSHCNWPCSCCTWQ